MIDQVTIDMVQQYNGDLSGVNTVLIGGSPYTIATRYTYNQPAIEKATQYAYDHFQSLPLKVSYHEYEFAGTGTRRNVIAEQTGAYLPEQIFLITAHLDSTSGYADTLAPGADDNASGSTAVLIAADLLSQYEFGCTLRYALFTGEEQGLYGSRAYAASLAESGEMVAGVLNLDMIGYNSDDQPIVDLHARDKNNQDLAIARTFAEVVTAYNLNLVPEIFQDSMPFSDHASFWGFQFPAILAIEDRQDFNPHYHTTRDTLKELDPAYFTEFVKASVGTFAHMGCLPVACTPVTGADFSFSPAEPILDETVSFAASVAATTTQPLTFTWDFGDGLRAEGAVVTHSFTARPEASIYSIELTAGNGCSLPQIVSKEIVIQPLRMYLPLMLQEAH
jgi:hypothetical protein